LATASLAVQGFADVETLGGTRPVSLFALTIAPSGERKSSFGEMPLTELVSVDSVLTGPGSFGIAQIF
jgi:hypothetical protein